MTETTLNEKLKLLSVLRENDLELKEKKKLIVEEFELTHKGLFDEVKNSIETIGTITQSIKEQALNEAQKQDIKSFDNGIQIKMFKRFNYDEKEAFDWCKEHSLCLQTDTKAFKELIKTQHINLIFVNLEEEATAQIPGKIDVSKLE